MKPLDLSAVEIRGGPLVRVSDAEIDELEERLGTRFPDGYREYLTRLGEGTLRTFVRVLPPWGVLDYLDVHRGAMAGYWFWDSETQEFDQQCAMESIAVADTLDGDVMAFHPADPQRIVILPRNAERLFVRGPDLLETIEWVLSGRVLRAFGPQRYFEPFDSRVVDEGEAARAGRSAEPPALEPPDLTRSPREVLLAYFGELRDIEEASLDTIGGPKALGRDEPPPISIDEDFERLLARTAAVHARYCSPALAKAKGGASVVVSWPLAHDPSSIRVLGETEKRPRRVAIRTSEGTDTAFLREYTLEQSNGDWRIVSE